jgi:glutathione gamma-glutamylcysteinyltransferase
VALSSPQGQRQFASALSNHGLKSFFVLMEQFTTQSEPAFCGMTSLTIALNALAVDPRRTWKGPWRWYEESMLNCCLDLEQVKQTGITMNDFRCLAVCQGLQVTTAYADADDSTVDAFRDAVKNACVMADEQDSNTEAILVVSYSRAVLGQTGTGHFSPVAAYDSVSDSVLVLDTARFKYGVHWVSLPLLFDAMKPKDPSTQRSRGFMLLREHDRGAGNNSTEQTTPSLIPSILFRSQRTQNPIRRQYKEFLATLPKEEEITLDQVMEFWTQNKIQPNFIWSCLEPQLTPVVEGPNDQAAAKAQIKLIEAVQRLIRELLLKVPHGPFPRACCQCRINYLRTLDVSAQEAIFIVYLASLDEARRTEIVGLAENTMSGDVAPEKTQLLAEAELLRYSIDMSDE